MFPDGQRILVIDRDTERRQLSERVLIEEGFAVTAVAEGFSAIRAATGGRFALAIAAIDLPGTLDGLSTLRQLRARQPSLRVLFTGEVASRPRRPDRDGDEFIATPFLRRDLLGCVFELLQRDGARSHPLTRDFRRAS